jgi:methylmalonyl-CoA decarboxylase
LLGEFISQLEISPAPRALIVQADPAASTWSAGHDIREIPRTGQDPLAWTNPLEAAMRAIEAAPFPVIAAVHGGVWGGACDLVMTCDIVIAEATAAFAITPAKLGVPYNGYGIGHFLSALPIHIAKHMFFTGDPISAGRLHALGGVNELADTPESTQARALELAQTIAVRAPLSIRAIKAEFNALGSPPPQTIETLEHLTALRRAAWESADLAEGLRAFEEKRPPHFTGE